MKPICLLRGHSGFTLVEVFLAILIFILGILPLVRLEVASIEGNSYAQKLTAATTLAQSKMEELLTMDYADLISATPVASTICPKSGDCYTINWTCTQVLTDTRTIVVTVTWADKNDARSISFSCIKAK